MDDVTKLTRELEAALVDGQLQKGVSLAEQILKVEPTHETANKFLGHWFFFQEDFKAAIKFLETLTRHFPGNPEYLIGHSQAAENLGDFPTALKLMQKGVLDFKGSPAFLFRMGHLFEAMGEKEKSISAYFYGVEMFQQRQNAKVGDLRVSEDLSNAFKHARAVLYRWENGIHKKAMEDFSQVEAPDDFLRIRNALYVTHSGQSPSEDPLQDPLEFFVPGLKPRPWFEREEFDWVRDLEKNHQTITREVKENLDLAADTRPYIQAEGRNELMGSKKWGACHFFDNAQPNPGVHEKFPKTSQILKGLPLFALKGVPYEALFSILQPNTSIFPHYGITNVRLVAHLPLIVPENCGLKVGDEERPVRAGKVMIFDDSFKHSAWNKSDQNRIILIFQIWHPDLTPPEKRAAEESQLANLGWRMGQKSHEIFE